VRHSFADIAAAQRDLGYQVLVPIREGLHRTVAWYLAEHQRKTQAPTLVAGHV
jgi:nucleoside-diphosphate-sugar epimerase